MTSIAYHSTFHTRTAGTAQYKSVQSWKARKTTPDITPQPLAQKVIKSVQPTPAAQIDTTTPAQKAILGNLDKATDGKVGIYDVQLDTSLAYAGASGAVEQSSKADKGYQFGDVVDVVNPLHHLPIVGMVYRGMTGDKIHPMSQVLGGALYGGPIGAVSGTVNAVSQIQTGKDIGDHAMGFVGLGSDQKEKPIDFVTQTNNGLNPALISSFSGDNTPQIAPLEQLTEASESRKKPQENLGSALSFVNLSEPSRAYEKVRMAEGRTAGSMIVEKKLASYRQQSNIGRNQVSIKDIPVDFKTLPKREEITTVQFSAMPPKREI